MRKNNHAKKVLNIWTILSVVVTLICILSYVGYGYVINSDNVYTDFLVGDAAYLRTNKVGEWHLFWFLLFLAMTMTAVLAFLEGKKIAYALSPNKKWFLYAGLVYLPFCTHLLIYNTVNLYFLLITVLVSGLVMIFRENCLEQIALFTCIYFGMEVPAIILSVFGHSYFQSDKKVLFLAFVLYFLILLLDRCFKDFSMTRVADVVQIWIPFLFLLYLKDTYQNGATIEKVPFPQTYICFVVSLIFILVGITIYQIVQKNKIKTEEKRQNADAFQIYFSTVFSTFSFVSYMSPALILPFDLHHHGEQILPWQQIVELGQKAYDEYSPASGFFPMILGCINRVMFHGYANAYNMSFVIFALIFEAITIFLLYRKIGGRWALLFAVLFHMPVYCRGWMILPTLLLWSDRKLIENKALWLMSYVFVSFLDGLYYPLYGAALLLGAFPFAVLQVIAFFKKSDFKKKYVIPLFLLLGVIAFYVPLLFRMLKHILSMSGQTVFVDGISIFQSEIPNWFMPFLSGFGGYSMIYYLLRFTFGIIFVVMAVYLLCRFIKQNDKKIQTFLNDKYFMLSCVPPIICICYTYTMVCMDEDWVANLLSRSVFIILFVGMFLQLFLISYGKELLGEKNRAILMALVFCVPFLFFEKCEDYEFPTLEGATDQKSYVIAEYQSKMLPYSLGDGYVLLDENIKEANPYVHFERIGDGYVSQNVMERLNKIQFTMDFLREFDPDVKILGFEQSQFFYYFMNEKAVYSGRTSIARSREAVEEVLTQIDPEHTVVRTGVIPLEEYYLYRYLVEQGYSYSPDLDLFLPNKLYVSIYGSTGNYDSSVWVQDYNCFGVASSFAKSLNHMKYLHNSYEDMKVNCVMLKTDEGIDFNIQTDCPIEGRNVDFLYVKIDDVSGGNLCVSFNCVGKEKEECSLKAWLEDGELLIPVGTNANWLTETHDSIILSVSDAKTGENIDISKLAFYKLDELESE